MPISLTKEEFLARFEKYHSLFTAAILKDVEDIFPSKTTQIFKEPASAAEELNLVVNLSEPIGKLVRKTIIRVVDLVYLEALE